MADDGDLMRLLTELSAVKADYDRVSSAIRDARETGYGVVVPTVDELILEDRGNLNHETVDYGEM